ncbi:MAG: peroxiredoxin [Phycisphaerales bacterium]|nr:peroxiredoxin [Phycisphaerales bacterium]
MTLKLGDLAPAFSLPTKPGEVVDVGALFGKRPVVILFFPLAFSSVCTAELCHFRDDWSRWSALECDVFGVSIDSPFVADTFRTTLGLPFPLLSDFNKTVATEWGAIHEELAGLRGVTKRAVFVVDRAGKISYAAVQESPKEQVQFDEIFAAVQAAK